MEMIRVLAMVPSEGMAEIMRTASQSVPDLAVEVILEGTEEAKQLVKYGGGLLRYAAVLAQGKTYEKLKEAGAVPVIEIPVSFYDLLSAARLAAGYTGKKILIAPPRLAEMADSALDLAGLSSEIETVAADTVTAGLVNGLKAQEYSMFLGDSEVNRVCRENGINSVIMLASGFGSAVSCLREAQNLISCLEKSRLPVSVLEEYAGHLKKAYLLFDFSGTLRYAANAELENRLVEAAAHLIPLVKQEKAIQKEKKINESLYLIKGSVVALGKEHFLVFEVKKSLFDSKTNIPGVMIKNTENLTKDFFNVFYDDTKNKDFRQKTDAYSGGSNTVVIIGESGTGKSRLADYIYANSDFRNAPLYLVDCKRLGTRSLHFLFNSTDSPLYEQGIALYFKELNYLKEKYLNELVAFLQQSPFVHKNKIIFSVTCSVSESYNNKVCEFLTSRLSAFPLYLTPLRERVGDIPNLAVLYINELNREYGKKIIGFEPEAMNYLQSFRWDDNVKQFKRVLKELFMITGSLMIPVTDVIDVLSEEISGKQSPSAAADASAKKCTLDETVHNAVKDAMIANGMNRTQAANQLGISRTTLWRLLKSGSLPVPSAHPKNVP